MKHRVRIRTVTERKGLFGIRRVVRRKTVTVRGKKRGRGNRAKWNEPARTEAERLAALCRIWEEEKAAGGR